MGSSSSLGSNVDNMGVHNISVSVKINLKPFPPTSYQII